LQHCGRMNNAVWAPQFQSVRLLDDAGRNLKVKKIRIDAGPSG